MATERFSAFFQTFEHILKNIKRIASPVMQTYGLRRVHVSCILALGQNPKGLTVTDLSRDCFIDKGQTSRIIRELLENNYIVPLPEEADRNYNKHYVLSEKSHSIMSELDECVGVYMEQAGKNISPRHLAVFYRVLHELDGNIDAISQKSPSEF